MPFLVLPKTQIAPHAEPRRLGLGGDPFGHREPPARVVLGQPRLGRARRPGGGLERRSGRGEQRDRMVLIRVQEEAQDGAARSSGARR